MYLCLVPLLGLSTLTQTDCSGSQDEAIQECLKTKSFVEQEKLLDLQNRAAEQILEIENILDQICNHLSGAHIKNKDSVCREMELLHEFVKNIGESNIYELDEEGLVHLLEINELLIQHLAQHLSGDLGQLCEFDLTAYKNKKRSMLTLPNAREHYEAFVAELSVRYDQVQDKIKAVWKQVKELNLNSFNRAFRAVEKFACDYHLDTIAKRSWPYVLCALYLLRQQKDADVAQWNCPLLNGIKKYVGSPNEKKSEISLTIRDDMTIKEQEKWIKKHGCEVAKVKKGRDCGFLRDLNIKLVDSDFAKLTLTSLFLPRVKQDFDDLTNWLSAQWNKLHAKLIGETEIA